MALPFHLKIFEPSKQLLMNRCKEEDTMLAARRWYITLLFLLSFAVLGMLLIPSFAYCYGTISGYSFSEAYSDGPRNLITYGTDAGESYTHVDNTLTTQNGSFSAKADTDFGVNRSYTSASVFSQDWSVFASTYSFWYDR